MAQTSPVAARILGRHKDSRTRRAAYKTRTKESQDLKAIVCQTQQAERVPWKKGKGGEEERVKVEDGGEERSAAAKKRLFCFRVTGSGNESELDHDIPQLLSVPSPRDHAKVQILFIEFSSSIRSGGAVTMNNQGCCI